MKSLEVEVVESIGVHTEKSTFKKIITNQYLRFVLKKGLFYFLVFYIGISIAFLIPRLVPGTPLDYIYSPPGGGGGGSVYDAWVLRMEAYYLLDQPMIAQYWHFIVRFFQGDLGESYYAFRPIQGIIIPYILPTMLMVLPAVLVTFILGNLLGGRTGYAKGKANKVGYYSAIALQSAPFYWLGYLFLYIFIIILRIVPFRASPINFHPDNFAEIFTLYWIPFAVLVICFTGGWATGMRSLMIYEKESNYIQYSQKLGFKEGKLRKYAMRNSILPQVTGLNLRFNEIMGATLVIESIFNWPGIGTVFVQSALQKDHNLIVGAFIFTIIVIVVGNFLIDIIYGVLDPRIRIGSKEV